MNEKQRIEWIHGLFEGGPPRLWCPPIMHYHPDGSIDRQRVQAHLRHLTQWVRGFLVPGSTGDAWEMSAREQRETVELLLPTFASLGVHLLIGVLAPDVDAERRAIEEWTKSLNQPAGPGTFRGFTVCGPSGDGQSQEAIQHGLVRLLETGHPIAIYQLPQVTRNEIAPETIAALAGRFSNFILFKDSSGRDAVCGSGVDLGGVFTMRGAEGGYFEALSDNGGPYDGLLLSTANWMAGELECVIALSATDKDSARDLSQRLSEAIESALAVVADLPRGNMFSNSAKCMDHLMAYGTQWQTAPPPRFHGGEPLPTEVIADCESILRRHDLLLRKGYLA